MTNTPSREPAAFTPADVVFSCDGRAASYVGRHPDGHIVAPLYDDEEGEHLGSVETWREVFRAAPTPRVDAEIATLQGMAQRVRDEIATLNAERRTIEGRRSELIALASFNAALGRIGDYLSGRMKFAVMFCDYSAPEFGSIAKMLESGHFPREQKLVSLFGDSKGDLLWRANQYRDGSGSGWREVVLFETEAECIDEIRRRFALAVERWRTEPKDQWRRAVQWADKCAPGLLAVPEDLANYMREGTLKALQEAEAKAQADLDKARAALSAALGAAPGEAR